MKRVSAVLAALAAVLVLVPAAHAGDATTCDGLMVDVVVEGDLVVPSGATCQIAGVHVLGDVTVEPDGELGAYAIIEGSVTIASGGVFDTSDSAIGDDVTCIECRYLSMMFMFDPSGDVPVRGDIRVTGMTDGSVHIEAGPIAGDVEVTDSSGDFSFIDNGIGGNLLFSDNVGNAGFWYNLTERDFEVTGNTSAGGGYPADFTLENNRAGKDLVFSDNVGPSEFAENYAQKDLECVGNDPAPSGWGNGAGKDVEGQCIDLTGPLPED